MDAEKEKLLNLTYQKFMDLGLGSHESPDILDNIVAPDIMGFGTTIDERMFSIFQLKDLLIRQEEQTRGMQLRGIINSVFQKVLKDENTAIFVDDIEFSITVGDETIKMNLRFSIILEYQNEKWLVIHFHGSKPENVTTDVDTYGIDKWKKRNAELEKLVKERTAALEKSLVELKATQSQLIQSEKMASLGELTAGIAHEIQNPLNFVNNFSEVSMELMDEMEAEIEKGDMVEARTIAKDIKQNLEKINYHGKRADGIVKGMLQQSRVGNNVKEPTNINLIADEYLRLAYHGLRAKDKSFNAELVTNFEDNLPKIKVIPQDIGRVLLNLITNAFYATHQKQKHAATDYKPLVSITTLSKGKQIEIIVKDNGIGIPHSIKDKIMQPFFTTKPTGEGTGLGLSLSYDIIVNGHSGTISIDSKENEYTIFTIHLPLI